MNILKRGDEVAVLPQAGALSEMSRHCHGCLRRSKTD